MRGARARRGGPPPPGGGGGEDARAAPVQGRRRRAAREGRGRVRRGGVDQGLVLTSVVSHCEHVQTAEHCVQGLQALLYAELAPVRGIMLCHTRI